MEENAILGSSEDLSVQSQNTSTICTIHDRIIDILSTECTIGSLKYKKILNELKKVKSLGDITNWQEDCIKLAEDSCDKPSPESVSYPILKTIFDFIWKTDFDAWGQFLNDLINQEQSTEGSRIMLLELFKTIRIDCDDQEFINSAFNLTYQLLEDVDEEASYEEIAIIMESIDHFLFYGTKKTRFFQFKNPKNVFNKIIEWFVESESREKLKSACISLMKHFKNYWKTNLEEAKTMVSILMIDMIAFLVDTEEVAEEDESSDQFRSECLFFVVRSIIRAMPETEDLTFIFEKMEDNSDKFQILTQDKSDKLLVHFLYISDTILFRNDLSNEKGLAFLRGLFDLIMRSGFKPLTFAIKLIRFFDADSKMKLATKVINEQMYEKLWNSDKTIIERSVKTLQDILTSEDTPIIQHIYQLVSQRLLQLTDDLVKMFKEKDVKLNEFNLLASQCSNYLRALVIFLTTKKSPIILMVLNPSIYSLLFEKLPVKCQRFIQSNAQLTALVLITQKCFSLTYGHFVANCVWESKESATSVLQLSPSSKYLQGIINQIVFWLNNFRYLDEETILLLTTWVVSFIKENYAFAMANFYNHTFKKLRRAMALFALKYMGSFKFDDYFEDKGHYMKNGPLDNQEEKTVIDNMNLALVILERSQWIMLQDLDMDMFAQFLRISQNCDHTQFMFMMKVLPANWILKKSLSHQFVPSVQKDPIQYETTPFDKQDYIRIMDFVYQNVNMDSHFQRDFFLKWVFDPNQVIITTNAPNVTIYDKWNAIATKFCVYVIQEHFNTPVGNMTKTILHMQEVSTLLSAEIKELIGIKNEELDLFNEYKAAVQEKIHFKPFGSKSPDSSLQTNPDYEFNFEYEGIDQVFTDRAPLYEEVILRYTLWIKIVYSMIKYIHCGLECPHFLDSNKVDTKFLLDNFAELNQGLKDMVQPVIEIAFRIGDYGSVVKLSEFLIKQIDCSDFIDGQITKFSDEQRIIKLYPWLARAYLRTNSSDSIVGLHNYLKKFLNPKDLKWLDALVLITNGNIEDGLKKLNNLYCPLFQKHIIEIIHECASILRIPNIKNFLNQFEETLNMYDTSENDYLHAHNLFTANSKKMCDWKACSNEVQAEFLAIPDQQIYVNSIETNIAETYEGFNDLKSLNLKKYNRILWQTSELLRTISHTSLFLTPNLSNFSHAYSTFLITEDVKKRLTLRLNKVPFYEDVELQLKGINSQMFVDHCKSNALDSIQIGRKFSHWIQHSGHYIHGSSSSRFHLNMAKVARKTGNINTAKEEFSLYKNVFAKIYKHEHSRDAMEAFVESVKLDQLISINKPNSKNCMHGMTKVLSTYFDQLMNDYMHNDSKKFFNNSPDLTIEDIFTKQYEGDDKTKYCQFRLERVKRLNTASKSILFLADQFLNNTDYSSKQAQMNNPVNGAFKIFLQPYVSYNNMETIYTNYDDQYYNALCKLSAQFSPANRKAYFKIGEFNFNNSSLNEKDDIILADTAKQFIADLLLHFNICDVDREIEQAVSRSANLVLLRSKISKFLHEGGKIKSCAEQITDQLINYDGFADMFNCHVDQQTKSFTVATQAYFQYLCLSTESVKCSDITKAALLILRMLVKYPFQISRIINQWIQKTNEDVWKNILPQLFARLNHPNKIVRDTVCNMLETVANSSPHVLCFPVVVGKRNIKDEDDEFR
uniref:DUF4704 domain-containing protein n=1 Tax=Rhabditophanes sp. KR3021 TaxID=114890 RepID=A0AC35TUB8_9BILA